MRVNYKMSRSRRLTSLLRIFFLSFIFIIIEASSEILISKPRSNNTLNMTQDPPFSTIGAIEKSITAHLRENIEITCPISCDPSCIFHWTKGGASIVQWDRFYFPTTNKSQLQIRALKREDSGSYECLGVNGFGSTGARIRLIVDGNDTSQSNLIKRTSSNGSHPEIMVNNLPTEEVINLKKGKDLTLTCQATGTPSPNVTWYKNNLYLLGSRENVLQLQLTNVSEKDNGAYKCEALNEFGTATYVAAVRVESGLWNYGTAKIIRVTPTNLTLFPGESGAFTCIVRSTDAFNKPFLFWVKRIRSSKETGNIFLHNGEPLEILNRTDVTQKSANIFSTTLHFINVTEEKGGRYVCVVAGPMADEFEYGEASLYIFSDTDGPRGHQKSAIVQRVILWTFGILVLIIISASCFTRIFKCPRWKSKPPIPVSRSSRQESQFALRIPTPSKSPGETVSTTLTHQNEVYSPLIYRDVVFNSNFSGTNSHVMSLSTPQSTPSPVTPSFCHSLPKNRKRSRAQRRQKPKELYISDSSSSWNDSVFDSPSRFNSNSQKMVTSRPLHEPKVNGSSSFLLHRMTPFERQDPPCTPVTTISVTSLV